MHQIIHNLFNKAYKIYKIRKINKTDKVIFLYRTDLIGDYISSRVFLELIKKSDKFNGYKIVAFLNIAIKDLAIKLDSKYVDEFIFYNPKIAAKKCNVLKNILNKYNFEYLINYHALRQRFSEDIAKIVNAKNKFASSKLAFEAGNIEKEFNSNYTKLFDIEASEYHEAAISLAQKITGEKLIHKVSKKPPYDCKSLKLPYPYIILFPSASCNEKRMPFTRFLKTAEYVRKKFKEKNIDIKCIILGSKNDNKLIKNHNIDKSYIINSCGKYKLSELPNIFQNALFVVTNETCAVHFSRLSGLKNAIVFCNIYYPDTNTVNYFSKPQIKNTEKFLNGKKGNYGYYYLYPKISIDKAVDKTYKPTDEVDLRINQQLDGIKQEHIEAVIDLLIDEISSNKSKK